MCAPTPCCPHHHIAPSYFLTGPGHGELLYGHLRLGEAMDEWRDVTDLSPPQLSCLSLQLKSLLLYKRNVTQMPPPQGSFLKAK